ncbi:SDR family oxidoreductase [Paraburkholderia kururiensis]|uniref:SDR family oxidoreductase n=1 Tax=Paraburkholderia kururiensis TaxID=984307 RepID=UPI0005AA0FD5|nr:SDR family oxidoreductase [Paraburkholderia kururiensis]
MNYRDDLRGVRAAITGGTSGLGLALMDELLVRGARVAFVARDPQRVAAVAAERPGVVGLVGDIGRKDDIYPLATQITGLLGSLDVLVNNASSLGPTPLALLGDTQCEDFEAALAVNVLGAFRLTKAMLGSLAASAREHGGALVLNVSSDAAIEPYARWGAYGSSKAALRQMSRIWNAELADERIRVLTLDPGDMDTPLHRLALPDADPATLRRPADAAHAFADVIASTLDDLRENMSMEVR